MAKTVGKRCCRSNQDAVLYNYDLANACTAERGIVIADMNFDFGLDESLLPPAVHLDEVLTPNSSGFWDTRRHDAGRRQDSYDKQYLRGQSPVDARTG